MLPSSEQDAINLVLYQDRGQFIAIIYSSIPRLPERYDLCIDAAKKVASEIDRYEAQLYSELGEIDQATLKQQIKDFCERLYQLLLPEGVRNVLERQQRQKLILHLDPCLAPFPWEYLHNGKNFLCVCFDLSRSFISDNNEIHFAHKKSVASHLGAVLKALLIVDPMLFDAFYLRWDHGELNYASHSDQGVKTTVQMSVKTTAFMKLDELHSAAFEYSLIHYIGPLYQNEVNGTVSWQLADTKVPLHEVVPFGARCSLIISEHVATEDVVASRQLARSHLLQLCLGAECASLVNPLNISLDCRLNFQFFLYHALSEGASVGEALLVVRERLLDKRNLAWANYQLFGDSGCKLAALSHFVSESGQPNLDRQADLHSEYRQLTVMFFDIADSTAISNKLGLSEWDEILKDYNEKCAHIVNRYGGSVHQYKGDGMVIYFGHPVAYEDGAKRAVRAAEELTQEFKTGFSHAKQLLHSYGVEPLRIRVSIHTGPVIVADVNGHATATGVTVAFAERMQHAAPENRIIISAETYSIIKFFYQVEKLEKLSFKGFSNQKQCYLIEREFDASGYNRPNLLDRDTPFLGRDTELASLFSLWQTKNPARLRSILISGEAGIGKSRLLREFHRRIKGKELLYFEARCSVDARNSALYPLVQGLKHLFKIQENKSDSAKLTKIQTNMARFLDPASVVPAIASLFSIPFEKLYKPLPGTADQQKIVIREALYNWLKAVAATRPVCFVIEDVQWIDPSTWDFLQHLPAKLEKSNILVIMTYRIEAAKQWSLPFSTEQMELLPVSENSSRAMVASICGAHKLPTSIIDLLIEKTDGVPLFIEESTRMAVEAMDSESDVAQNAHRRNAGIAIPETILDLLTARLDRTGEAKEVAQIGAVIGREFSYSLLLATCDLAESSLRNYLATLVSSGLIKPQEIFGQLIYSFKHALVRDAAYQSLMPKKCCRIHKAIAEELERSNTRNQPGGAEVLAQHFTSAGSLRSAIECWMLAGREAVSRAAPKEAISHFKKALLVLQQHAKQSQEIDTSLLKVELKLQLALGGCHCAVNGYAATETGNAFERAERLALDLRDDEALLKARSGLEAYHNMRGNFNRSFELASNCLQLVESAIDPNTQDGGHDKRILLKLAQAYWTVGNVLFHMAEFKPSIPHLDRCLELCTKLEPSSRRMVQDPAVMSSVYKAWYLWEAGYPDQALNLVQRGVALARQCGHPFSIGVALSFQACIHFFRREFRQVIELANESISVCEEPGFRTWYAWAKVLRGRALSEYQESRKKGIADIEEGFHLWVESNAIITRPFALALLAESHHLDGDTEKALALARDADAIVQQYGERYYEAEIYRLQGVFAAKLGNLEEALVWFERALDFARQRQMRSSQLRILSNLIDTLSTPAVSECTKPSLFNAQEQLGKLLNDFGEGFKTSDVKHAISMLAPSSQG